MQTMIDYAKSFVGTPYIWGGNGPVSGFDCSGFVQYVLDSCGLDPKGDQTAQGLYNHFIKEENHHYRIYRRHINFLKEGALVFYGKSTESITHISLAIDSHRIIEAGGGGRLNRTREDAVRNNACVRIKPFTHRTNVVKIIMPKYPDYMYYDVSPW